MERPGPFYHRTGVYSNNLPFREEFSDDADGRPVMGVIKDRNDYHSVRDIEVRVACRVPRVTDDNGSRHGEVYHREWFFLLVGCTIQDLKILSEGRVIFIGRIFFIGTDNGGWRNKPRDVIDVTIGIIACNALVEPDNFYCPEIFLRHSSISSFVRFGFRFW